ncbi:MAG: hypothetical protein AAGA85_24375, partial [Bacteroidota bacterium]
EVELKEAVLMSKLTITGNIKVKAEHLEFVKSELLKLIPITRAELNYRVNVILQHKFVQN